MATVAQDTFTEAADTALSAHAPDIGTGWTTVTPMFVAFTVLAATDRLEASEKDAGGARENTSVGSDNMDVSFTLVTPPAGVKGGLAAGRIPSGVFDAKNGYYIVADKVNNKWELHKLVADVTTLLGTYVATPAAGDTMKLQIRTAAKKVLIASVERISSTDDSLTGNFFAGLLTGRVGADDKWVLDDFLSESVAAAAFMFRQRTNTLLRM